MRIYIRQSTRTGVCWVMTQKMSDATRVGARVTNIVGARVTKIVGARVTKNRRRSCRQK